MWPRKHFSWPQANSFFHWSCWRHCTVRVFLEQKVPKPQPPMGGRGGAHQTAQTLPISPKQVMLAANGPAEMRLQSGLRSAQPRSLSPSISCPAGCQGGSPLGSPCQPDWKCQMQTDRAGVWGRNRLCHGDGWRQQGRHSRDFYSVPHIWQAVYPEQLQSLRHRNSGVFFETLGLDHGNPGWATRNLCERRFSSACYFLETKTHGVSWNVNPQRGPGAYIKKHTRRGVR